jgi:putative transposase
MGIEKSFFNKESMCTRSLGKKLLNKSNLKYNTITKDCKLHYCKLNNRFTLLIPEEKTKKKRNKDNSFISIDPGIRTFLTCISNDKHIEVCTNMYGTLKKLLNKIDKVKKNKNKVKYRLKLKNKVTDLHWKSINFLMNQNKSTIVIGNWSTKQCVSKKGTLNKMLKRVCLSLRYYEFLMKLRYKSNYNNISLKIQDESYTSKLCSTCGTINNKLGSSKVFNCLTCKTTHDRDVNACRNILMKSLD